MSDLQYIHRPMYNNNNQHKAAMFNKFVRMMVKEQNNRLYINTIPGAFLNTVLPIKS